MRSWSPPGTEPIARFFSFLGGEQLYLILIPCLLWFAPWPGALRAARAMVITDLAGEWIKWTLLWPRPDAGLALAQESSPGFVSTHAAISMSVAVVLAAGHPRLRPWLALWVIGVGWSRLALGVHFPLDVVGGWLLGALIAVVLLGAPGNDTRRASHLCLGFAMLLLVLWPQGGVESLQRDLGMLLGLELAMILRLQGQQQAEPPGPLSLRAGALRLLLVIGLYLGLKALAWPRLLRYLALGLAAGWRRRREIVSQGANFPASPPV